MLLAISFVLAIAGCISLYLISHHKPRAGWYVNLALQGLWLPYDFVTRQYGFIVISGTTFVVAISSLRKVRQARGAKVAAIHSAEETLRASTRSVLRVRPELITTTEG